MSNPVIDLFVEEARGISVTDAGLAIGLPITTKNYAGPCPQCGGHDRFSINPQKQAWNCRQCGGKGRDGISLMALVNGHDIKSRAGFLAACADALGRPVPDGGEIESDADRQARVERMAAQKRRNAEAAAASQKSDNLYRQREVDKARGLYLRAPERPARFLRDYLRLRTGFEMHDAVFDNLRGMANTTYWHGKDERGYEVAHYSGPAMIAPFVNLDGHITGCHQTWIDLRRAPKYRPALVDDNGDPLVGKKMRGTKKGSLIPLFGLMASTRWVGGEGIENGLTIAGSEGFRADTFYFAAGDLGNLAGPADPKSAFSHPTEMRQDVRGRRYPVKVAGPVPKPDQTAEDAMAIPDHVTEVILLVDADSEPVMTAAAIARAEARLAMPGRHVWEWRSPGGTDFSSFMTGQ